MRCQLFYCAIAWYYKTNMNTQWHTYYTQKQKLTALKKTIDTSYFVFSKESNKGLCFEQVELESK